MNIMNDRINTVKKTNIFAIQLEDITVKFWPLDKG